MVILSELRKSALVSLTQTVRRPPAQKREVVMYEFAFASYIDHSITFYTDGKTNKFSEEAFRKAVAELGKRGWKIVAVNNGLYLQRAGLPNTA